MVSVTSRKEMARLEIRLMRAGDAVRVVELLEQLGYRRAVEAVRVWIEAVAGSADQAAFVASFDQHVVGWIEVSMQRRLQTEPFALIGGLVVGEGMRSQGVGRRLIAQAEQWSWERGAHKVRVTSRSSRTRAHRFYLREGYLETKTSLVFEKSAVS